MTDDPESDPEELAERVAELEGTLRELRREVERPPPPPRGLFGLPRPPTPGELLRFADRHAIPTAIAVLEANIRALKLLQGAIQLADSGRVAAEEGSEVRDRAERASRASLDRLDSALTDLQRELERDDLPPNDEARSIIEEARALRDDVRERLAASEPPAASDHGTESDSNSAEPDRADARDNGDDSPPDEPTEPDPAPQVDVDAELRAIKRDLGALEDGSGDDADERADSDADERSDSDADDGDDEPGSSGNDHDDDTPPAT